MFEKVPKGDIQVFNCPAFYQLLRDYAGFSELCGIMQRSWNYAIPHPCLIPWGVHWCGNQKMSYDTDFRLSFVSFRFESELNANLHHCLSFVVSLLFKIGDIGDFRFLFWVTMGVAKPQPLSKNDYASTRNSPNRQDSPFWATETTKSSSEASPSLWDCDVGTVCENLKYLIVQKDLFDLFVHPSRV